MGKRCVWCRGLGTVSILLPKHAGDRPGDNRYAVRDCPDCTPPRGKEPNQ